MANDDSYDQHWSRYINDGVLWPSRVGAGDNNSVSQLYNNDVTTDDKKIEDSQQLMLKGNHQQVEQRIHPIEDSVFQGINRHKPRTKPVGGSGRSRLNVKAIATTAHLHDLIQLERPELVPSDLEFALDLSDLVSSGDVAKHYREYHTELLEKIYLGEGGRELIRAALKFTGTSGGYRRNGYKGASNMKLVTLAYKAGLWGLVQRCKIERLTENVSEVHLRFVKFMSDKKKFERQKYVADSHKKVTKSRTPDEFLKYYLMYGCLPPKFILSDIGRNCLRRTIRMSRIQNGHIIEILCQRQGISFKNLRRWNNTTLMYFLELLGKDYIQRFCIDWASALEVQGVKGEEQDYDELHRLILSRNSTDDAQFGSDVYNNFDDPLGSTKSLQHDLPFQEDTPLKSSTTPPQVTETHHGDNRIIPMSLLANVVSAAGRRSLDNIVGREGGEEVEVDTISDDSDDDRDISEEIFEVDDIDNITEDWILKQQEKNLKVE